MIGVELVAGDDLNPLPPKLSEVRRKCGWGGSFFGVLHGQERDAIEFYTEKKVVIERWPKEWSRKF